MPLKAPETADVGALPEETFRVSEPRPVAVIVLAAGEGTRMKSRTPKVLHALCGRSMLGHALAAASELDPQRLVVVAGHARDEVSAEAVRHAPGVHVVVQQRQAGTGHAVRTVTEALGDLPGIVVVTYGDTLYAGQWGAVGRALASAAITFAVAALSFYLYEHPINQLKRYFHYRARRAGSNSTPEGVAARSA